jgi:hypothetical protein
MEENRRTQRKTLEARERINNKLNSHMPPSPGIEPRATVVRGERSHDQINGWMDGWTNGRKMDRWMYEWTNE